MAEIDFPKINSIKDLEIFQKILSEKEYLHLIANMLFLSLIYLNKQSKINFIEFINKFFTHLSLENQDSIIKDLNFILEKHYSQLTTTEIDNSEVINTIIEKAMNNSHKEIFEGQEISEDNLFNVGNMKEFDFNPYKTTLPKPQSYISVAEGLKFIKPLLTEKAIKLINNKSTDEKVLSFLKTFKDGISITEIHNKYFPAFSLFHVLENIFNFSNQDLLIFIKTQELPKNQEFKIRLGDLLIFMELLTKENLMKLISIQRGESKMISFEQGKIIEVKTFPEEEFYLKKHRKLLGELMVDLNLINKNALEYILNLQKWYNSIFLYH